MSDPFLGEIRIFPFNFAPVGWAQCNGQIMAITQNTALFSLLGTNYGGNGTSNFGLPNLQGAVPLNQGQGGGLTDYVVGEQGGSPIVTLLQSEMALHNHKFVADIAPATSASPVNAIFMKGHFVSNTGAKGSVAAYSTLAPDTNMAVTAIGSAGGSQPHNNMMPFLTLNFCIALSGVFPPRS